MMQKQQITFHEKTGALRLFKPDTLSTVRKILAIVKFVRMYEVNNESIIRVVNRAATTVLDFHLRCKRLTATNPNTTIPQNIIDGAIKLDNILNTAQHTLAQISMSQVDILAKHKALAEVVADLDTHLNILQRIQFRQQTSTPFDTPIIEFGSNCSRTSIIGSSNTDNQDYICYPDADGVAGPVIDNVLRTLGISKSNRPRIKLGDNSKGSYIKNSANDVTHKMPLQYYNDHLRGQEEDEFFQVPEGLDVQSFINETLTAKGLELFLSTHNSRQASKRESERYSSIAERALQGFNRN